MELNGFVFISGPFAECVWQNIHFPKACPQTVFIEGIFRRIERWVEGPALKRRRLAAENISPRKLLKLSIKWLLYLLATLIITHSFLANCYRCVQLCPTGVDIRRGLQMECIACTACIDACDDVMTKIKKPVGLIRYDSLTGNSKKKYNFSYRAIIYFSLALTATVLLITSLALIQPIDVDILRTKDTPYSQQVIEDGSSIIINHFKFEISKPTKLKLEHFRKSSAYGALPLNSAPTKPLSKIARENPTNLAYLMLQLQLGAFHIELRKK